MQLGRERPEQFDALDGQQLADLLQAEFRVAARDDAAHALAKDAAGLGQHLVRYPELELDRLLLAAGLPDDDGRLTEARREIGELATRARTFGIETVELHERLQRLLPELYPNPDADLGDGSLPPA